MQYGYPNIYFQQPTNDNINIQNINPNMPQYPQQNMPQYMPQQNMPQQMPMEPVMPMMPYGNYCGHQYMPTEEYFNQVVEYTQVEEMPHIMNYNTHMINNCVRKHITIPRYTQTYETKYLDEYITMPEQCGCNNIYR